MPQLDGQHTLEPPTVCANSAATLPSIPAVHEPWLVAGGGGGSGLAVGQLQRLVWAHDGGVVQYDWVAQPATLNPGASPRQVDLHAVEHREDLSAASQVGTSGALVGGHVQTLPLAHDGAAEQYDSVAQPATLKPGASPRQVDTHASSHMADWPIASHAGATPASSVGEASSSVEGATISVVVASAGMSVVSTHGPAPVEEHASFLGMTPCAQQLVEPPGRDPQATPAQVPHSSGQQMRATGVWEYSAAVVYHEVPRMEPVGQVAGPAVGSGVGAGGGVG